MTLRLGVCVFQLILVLYCAFVVMNCGLSLGLLRHETDRFILQVYAETPKIVEVFVEENGLSRPGMPPEMALRLRLNGEWQTESYQSGAWWGLVVLAGLTVVQGVLIVRGNRTR